MNLCPLLCIVAAAAAGRPALGGPPARLRNLLRLSGGNVEWTAHQADNGRTYYYNEITGVSSWEAPAEVTKQTPVAGVWSRLTSDAGEAYYHNVATGEVRWDLPAGAAVAEEEVATVVDAGADPWTEHVADDGQ
eukprot:3347301-Prymnesium_polylepis.1